MRTAVFIDGYNLYYGRLRGTAYKWLDLVQLFKGILKIQNPNAQITAVRYLTAPALAKFATHGLASDQAQKTYFRALEKLYPSIFEKELGSHVYEKSGTSLPRFVAGQGYDRNDRVLVWKLEEKKTDVNLALGMYRAACSGDFDQIVLCSNDTDAEPALKAIRADCPNIQLGLIAPLKKNGPRPANQSLRFQSHWTRSHIADEELIGAQLPQLIPTGSKPILKPVHW